MNSALTELPRPSALSDVKGWFRPVDQQLFQWFLTRPEAVRVPGDLLEMGAYMGKSAIFMAAHKQPAESFTVCDLFDSEAPDAANTKEMNKSYATLTRRAFEANFLAFHDELPTVLQGPTSIVPEHVKDDTCRFVHVDASHLYDHVRGDIVAARDAMAPGGVVALDDYRAEHCPGVAYATWEAVATLGLRPLCVTGTKFYGTWDDAEPVRDALLEWLGGRDDMWHEVQMLGTERLIRVDGKKAATPEPPTSRHPAPAAEPKPKSTPSASAVAPKAATAARRPSQARRIARDLLPPVITRAVRKRMR